MIRWIILFALIWFVIGRVRRSRRKREENHEG